MFQYWFANIAGLSTKTIPVLMNYFVEAENIYFASEKELKSVGLSDKELLALEKAKKRNIEKDWNDFLETGINMVCMEEECYPERLKNIADPPYALFYKGNLPKEDKLSVSIVGARQRSAYGETMAQSLSEELAKREVQIISGLAIGIDADAHKGALNGKGDTYGVLGCGVEVVYPPGNRFLFQQILASDGGIISEYPIHEPAKVLNFPRRNRIISGLSDIVVVIEAKEKSGSLITADFAMEQGREVYALPGRVSEPLSAGCNQLIHDGAGVLLSVSDFLGTLGLDNTKETSKKKRTKISLEKEERLLYSLIDFTPKGIGTLLYESALNFTTVVRCVESLKAKNLIVERPSNFFVKSKL